MMLDIRPSGSMQWINTIAFVITLLINGIANTTILWGRTTGQVSDLYPTLVTPAGYVFSIWGVIYILLLVFVVYQALPSQRRKAFQQHVGPLFALSCTFNVTWLFLWQYDYIVLSVPLMFALLATLIAIYLRLNIGRLRVPIREKLSVHLPFSVYLGWISIAAIADVSAALVSIKWDGLGINPITWALTVIVVALGITLLVEFTRRDIAYSLVIIWALIGIAVNQVRNQSIVTATEGSAVIVAIGLALSIALSRLRR